jgi:hypothetical protein
VRGTVSREAAPPAAPGAPSAPEAGPAISGTVTGVMEVDRRRGWMTDARTTVVMHSTVTPETGSRKSPIRVQVLITQRLVLLKD